MATEHYTLIVKKDFTAKFKVTYKDRKFYRLEVISGILNDAHWRPFLNAIPQQQSGIEAVEKKYNFINYKLIEGKEKSIHSIMMDSYYSWYHSRNGLPPIIGAIGGKALKMIIASLSKLEPDKEEVVLLWEVILINWDKQEEFYRNQQELKQINSNLNIILRTIKHGGNSESKADNYANELRRKVKV